MSADYEGALLQLTITGGTSLVRRRPSTDLDKDGCWIFGILYIAGILETHKDKLFDRTSVSGACGDNKKQELNEKPNYYQIC